MFYHYANRRRNTLTPPLSHQGRGDSCDYLRRALRACGVGGVEGVNAGAEAGGRVADYGDRACEAGESALNVAVAYGVDAVAPGFEFGDGLGGQSGVNAGDGQGAVHAGGVYGFLRTHAVVDDLGNELGDAVSYPASAGGADREFHAVGVHDERGGHVVQRILAGHYGVDAARNGIEPHHAVVHHDAGPLWG